MPRLFGWGSGGESESDVAAAIDAHNADETSVHGIADTSVLVDATDVSSAISTHDGASTAHASATNLVQAGGDTMTGALIHPAGSAASPASQYVDAGLGIYRNAANQLGFAAASALKMSVTSAGVAALAPLAIYAGLWQQTQNIGATLNVSSSTTPSVLIPTQASCTINMPQVTWTTFPIEFMVADILGVLSALTINAWNDGVFDFNDINGADATYGAWTDGFGFSVGPFGAAASLTDAGSLWRMSSSKNDTGSGASGGWTIQKLATDLAY